jgi:hypothetical protein
MVKRRQRITPPAASLSSTPRSYFFFSIWTLLRLLAAPPVTIVAQAQYYDDSATDAPVRYNPVVSTDYCRLRPYQLTVSLISILCDTPGAYYSGSTAYRNSPVCVAGDKAQLDVVCKCWMIVLYDDAHSISHCLVYNNQKVRIPEGLLQYHNATAIYVQVEMGLYDHFTTVQPATSLCRMTVVRVDTDDAFCPAAGVYHWTTYYTVPYSLITDSNLQYVPDVRLTFTSVYSSSMSPDPPRLGCVITGPQALRTIQDRKAQRGGLLFGLGCALLLSLFGLLLSCRARRKRSAALVVYQRTLPNGSVPRLPLSPRRWDRPPMTLSNNSSEDGAPYGNPAYNETQLPSRPII